MKRRLPSGPDFAVEAGRIIGDVNYVHPFREGNGRARLLFLQQLCHAANYPAKAIEETRFSRQTPIRRHGAYPASRGQRRGLSATAASVAASWARMKATTPEGAIPANVLEKARAIVTAGLANDVDAVNQ